MAYEFGRKERVGATTPLASWRVYSGELLKIKERLGFPPTSGDLIAIDRQDLISAARFHGGLHNAIKRFTRENDITPPLFSRLSAIPDLLDLDKHQKARYHLVKKLSQIHGSSHAEIAWRSGLKSDEIARYLEFAKEAARAKKQGFAPRKF